jgi:crossover junction endodeoxyribonuclease RusA
MRGTWMRDQIADSMELPSRADAPFHCPPDPMIGGIVIDLPTPISVNRIWRANKAGKKAVSISPEYAAWKRQADNLTLAAGTFRGLKCLHGKFEAVIVVRRCPGDIDNRAKGVLDWLQSRGVIENDKHCERLTISWGEPGQAPTGCRVTVRQWV